MSDEKAPLPPEVRLGLELFGGRGKAIADYLDERVRRRRARLAEVVQAEVPPDIDIMQRLVECEELEVMLALSFDLARTASEAKFDALGRSLARGLAGDDATVATEHLVLDAIGQIDEPHVRALVAIRNASYARSPGGMSEPALTGFTDVSFGSVSSRLDNLGLAYCALVSGGTVDEITVEPLGAWWLVTGFGELVLERIEGAPFNPLSA